MPCFKCSNHTVSNHKYALRSTHASISNIFHQSSTPRSHCWRAALRLARPKRGVPAPPTYAAAPAPTSARAALPILELMLRLQGNCCPASRLNTCERQFSAAKYHPHFCLLRPGR